MKTKVTISIVAGALGPLIAGVVVYEYRAFRDSQVTSAPAAASDNTTDSSGDGEVRSFPAGSVTDQEAPGETIRDSSTSHVVQDAKSKKTPRSGTTIRAASPPPAVAPFDERKAQQSQQAWADHLGVPVEVTNSVGMKMALLPPGEFTMGSPVQESKGFRGNETQHSVRLTQPCFLGVYEVTQHHYAQVVGNRRLGPGSRGARNPMTHVSWNDAVEFCRKLSAVSAEKAKGHRYRLPTEAEWEYACRAGSSTAYSFGNDASRLSQFGWFNGNSESSAHPVGEKRPNAWGLHDMHGNVWEWCSDRFGEYRLGRVADPTGPSNGKDRVHRGGAWNIFARDCRSAFRRKVTPNGRGNDLGFRILCIVDR